MSIDTAIDNLRCGAAYLGAIELPFGDYTYYETAAGIWYVYDCTDVAELGVRLRDEDGTHDEIHAEWCLTAEFDPMAPGWEPSFSGKIVITLSTEDSHAETTVTGIAEDARLNDPDFSGAEIIVKTHQNFTDVYCGDDIVANQLLLRVRRAIAGVQS